MMWYDVLMLGIVLYAAIRGAARGFIWQVATIASIVFCFVFAERLAPKVTAMIPDVEPPLNRWLAMFILYLAFSFAAFVVARFLRDRIEKARFGEYDRHLGTLFGGLKGIAFCLVITFFVVTLSATARSYVAGTYSGYAAAIVMDRLHPIMPEDLHEAIGPYIHQLDRPGMDLRHAHGDDESSAHDDHGDEDHEHHSAGEGETHEHNDLERQIDSLATHFSGGLDDELRGLVLRALEKTDLDDRGQFMDQLWTSAPEVLRSIALQWQDGKPADPPTTAITTAERSDLLGRIGAVYSDFPEAQSAIRQDIERTLSGLPDDVVLAVLRDWHADLVDANSDPDTATNRGTSLDARIVRQLELAGIPLSSLNTALRQRLDGIFPR
jgi:membrane protein required for colicin V production